ncbi:acyl--CoA ligase [Protaetiibacter sp. SSC-01]|uniref:class I adenylate-forming enzyme family protein n=1 Tax=Protaetiibacter sp. SSC-01 TaxID=2759943 RepID=UPI0016575C46|nr:class I adenylate-forming enzyme family protein [Protaetiibacter sp. SSC-01]QNO38084.1 acyl--CoA ligase [Protaetiibacter sp. SSC-01]
MSDLVLSVLRACDATPDAPALTAHGRTWSYRELGRRIRSIAAGLADAGLAPGDRVLFSVRPGPDAVTLALGIVGAGGTVVFADPGAGEALFRARANLAAPRWVAAESLLYLASSGPLRPLARRRGLELAPYGRLVPDARHLRAGRWLPGVPRGALALDRLAAGPGHPTAGADTRDPRADRADRIRPGAPDDEALVVFTSGTTDVPKAVVHTRGSLGAGLGDFADGVGIRPGLRVLTDQLMVGIPALIGGAHWTMPAPGLDPGARPEAYLEHLGDAELLFASPATLDAILAALDARPELTPALETIVLGGAPVLPPLLRRAFERMPDVRIQAVYGMTEILPVAIADGAEKLAAPAGGGDAVGRLVPSVRARIDDGELVLSGAGLARGYLAELPEHPLAELHTGDLAELDGDRLVLCGRAKDMFIRGTQNVYPGLYEPLIAGLPGVADAAMAGVPDAIGDDRILVAVVPALHPPAETSTSHPLAAEVRRRLPGLIDAGVLPDAVVAVPALPRAGRSRKLDRAALAGMLAPFVPPAVAESVSAAPVADPGERA